MGSPQRNGRGRSDSGGQPAKVLAATAAPGLGVRLRLLARLADGGALALAVTAVLTAAQAMTPAAGALATGAVVSALRQQNSASATASVATLAAVLIVGQIVTAALRPAAGWLRSRVHAAHRERVAHLIIAASTMEEIEQDEVQSLITSAAGEPTVWVEKTIADGAMAQLTVLSQYLSLALSALVLSTYSWMLVPLLVVAALFIRFCTLRDWRRHHASWAAGTEHHRKLAYWGEVACAAGAGKEIRIFGLPEWVIAHGRTHIRSLFDPVAAETLRRAREKGLFAVLTFLPLAVVFVTVGLGGAQQPDRMAGMAVVLVSAWSVYNVATGAWDSVAVDGALVAWTSYVRLRARLAGPSRPATEPSVTDSAAAPPTVQFHQVCFSYPANGSAAVLDRLDITIGPGEMLAVVGLNGAGKSTFVKLLAGLYTPGAGRITADGVDIAALGARWHQRLTVAFQDSVHYHLTVRENVTYGAAGNPDLPALSRAAAEAGLDDLLARLPMGWDTPLARSRRHGVDLSGGQWQQVILARALYAMHRGARLLVLDEPTAHLDARTEFDIFQRLIRVRGTAGIVLISHRLATVRQADRIVFLERGRIVESGSHEELMAAGGRYAELFAVQARLFDSAGRSAGRDAGEPA